MTRRLTMKKPTLYFWTKSCKGELGTESLNFIKFNTTKETTNENYKGMFHCLRDATFTFIHKILLYNVFVEH